ncbi:MAG TPA: FtsX-like permease family protein [Pyrinomonadaceae bacterium]|nr:FtsX-like permease family protein [Pyrinomonadaceae bacterium]
MTALDRKLVRDLLRLRGQVAAVAVVVACGVAAFVAMQGTYRSLLATQAGYYHEFGFADVFAHVKRAPDSLAASVREIPGVGAVETRVVAEVTLDVPGVSEPAAGRLVSVPAGRAPELNGLLVQTGRLPEPGRPNEVVISGAFSRANNLQPGDTLDAVLNGRRQRLEVVGCALSPEFVYEIRGGEMFPDARRFGVIWMGRDALGPVFDMDGAFNDLSIKLAPGASEGEVIERLDSLLDPYGGTGAYGRADQTSHHFISNEIDGLRFRGTFIPAVFLAVTAFLIHLVLSRLVATEREQIGLLKAFGYTSRAVGLHYLKMALASVVGGAALGVVGGWWFGYRVMSLYAELFRFPVLRYETDWRTVLAATLISFGAAAVGALAAVRRAVRLPPAEAMRPEQPARFRPLLLERAGLQKLLPVTARMIVRNLERYPLKAVMGALGIALSVSLLVVGFYYVDAVEHIKAVQFNFVFREDATVAFNEPRPARARFELERLPGVLRAETFRAVPVRLRSGHRLRRVGLTGVEPGGELFRLVDKDFKVHRVPPEGLVLTTELAKVLGVRPGQDVTVEVLEGARPVREVTVAATVDELVGLSAYMDEHALNRLMREGGTISGAKLLVDAREAPRLYALLKRTPAVSGVIVPDAVLRNFNATVARSIEISTTVTILFACAIVVGVVYNGARIALSERGRELASLRVLGFTQREVGVMLLGEQALLTAAAVPLGYAVGLGLILLITRAVDTELMRLPLIVSGRTFALAFAVTACAALLSGLLVGWRLRRLDLVAVLKTRE